MKDQLIRYWIENNIITDKRVIEAFKKVKRENFILKEYKNEAYSDYPLPIGHNQTISQPTTIMIMTQALEVKPNDKILEVGTGSGYQAALLSVLANKGKIYTVEIIPELVEFAKKNLKNYKNVEVIKGDGSIGYEKAKPYDKCMITAACPSIPKEIIKQLKINGILVAPIGPRYSQEMLKITKKKDKLDVKNLGNFIFVSLRGEKGY